MDEDPDWVPYSQRPEWQDVTPSPLPDPEAPCDDTVVSINYSKQHREVLGYFQSCYNMGEKSQRVLELTADVIAANAAHYTAWQYRWEVLQALGTDVAAEYEFTKHVAEESTKNYQLWNHRRKIAKALGPHTAEIELQFCKEALDADPKNYHAWAHRQVIVAAAGCWQEEMQYVQQLIQEDVRNNSAWNQRMFVLQHTLSQYSSLSELLEIELAYVAEQIARAPDNESAWNYLWGLFKLPGCGSNDMGRQQEVYVICKEALSDCPSCKPALDTLVECYYLLAAEAMDQQAYDKAATAGRHGLKVLEAAAVADPIKGMYWKHRRQQLQQLVAQADAATTTDGACSVICDK